MFIELWKGLLDYYHDNNSATDIANAKLFINWAINDIANEFDWPFLRGTTSIQVSANGIYPLTSFNQLSDSSNVYAYMELSADNGKEVKMHGKYISGNAYYSTTNTYNPSADTGGAYDEGNNPVAVNYIDCFTKGITVGSVFITINGIDVFATLGPNDTVVANDIRKVTTIVDASNNRKAEERNYNDQLQSNPSSVAIGSIGTYDFDYNNNIRFSNISEPRTYSLVYQRNPKYLTNNTDITEFPRWFYPDIINYAHKVYGLRFQDEQDAWNGIQLKPILLQEIIRKHANMNTASPDCVPSWFKGAS